MACGPGAHGGPLALPIHRGRWNFVLARGMKVAIAGILPLAACHPASEAAPLAVGRRSGIGDTSLTSYKRPAAFCAWKLRSAVPRLDGAHLTRQRHVQPPHRRRRQRKYHDHGSATQDTQQDATNHARIGSASTRSRMLEQAVLAFSMWTAVEVAPEIGSHGRSWAQESEDLPRQYSAPDGSFALRYPATFSPFSKPLKTHKVEMNFKSDEVKGYEIGVAVDPVRIESIEKFGNPEEVGARVLKVEQGKDGTLDTKMFDTRSEKQGNLSLYTLDYFVESTRGFKHFVAKVTIKDNLLYACTAQAKEKDFAQVEGELKRMVASFRVPA